MYTIYQSVSHELVDKILELSLSRYINFNDTYVYVSEKLKIIGVLLEEVGP